MARLLGVQLPDDKRIEYALTMLYGIGWSRSGRILEQVLIDRSKKVKDLSEDEIKKIIEFIEKNFKVEGSLREEITGDVKRLKEINSYRGIRHAKNLPVRGQRTRSNARTKRGKRRTVGALRKETWAKMGQGKPGGAEAKSVAKPKS
ncbi:30S ribosomal protein S13 [Candidatus Roizmanbacteria bacterium RIFCSPHIGHO2_01_FULL_39_12c]|uniref:Small ribosomal subunit protein uS13 n=1 Tax=Candidatus Roizmanbacteria bacterium RIFCSPHIGHO2_01_FULL_39_12c TaxID=1802031 RepID=A0A1F7GE93_9BACT|nr:MAG: 30S ribosomal protein S13 [Candidatus Roizmanbacteria bacterium RIFCSPHIGHO2_01_FULL_39_12c]OGK47568.1 MAG: 30S ribosomal protein S13 [Candidatus Roizmanbacteria bacterium RIFCSPLOWO2_01_FULL_40_13]